MTHWALLLTGLYFLVVGVAARLDPGRLTEPPAPMSVEDARRVCFGDEQPFVRLDRGIDVGRALYSSALAAPKWTSCPRDAVVEADSPSALSPERAGCVVHIERPLDPRALALEGRSEGGAGQTFLFAPLLGSECVAWVISPAIARADREELRGWSRRDDFVGPLARLDDIDVNVPALAHSPAEIRAAWSAEFGEDVPSDAMVLVGGRVRARSLSTEAGKWLLAPVRGSDETLWVRAPSERLRELDGRISGVLRPVRAHDMRSLGLPASASLPARMGIIEPMTLERYNLERDAGRSDWLGVGLTLIVGALLFAFAKWRLFVHERREVEKEIGETLEQRRLVEAERARV